MFSGAAAALEQAIAADDAPAVERALAAGAAVDAVGQGNVSPLMLAVHDDRPRAAAALLRHQPDLSRRNADGDSAVTLAVDLYPRDPRLLDLLLRSGGDPDEARADGDPIIVRFIGARDLEAITYLKSMGANLDAIEQDGNALVANAAITQDWDVVRRLMELGAKVDVARTRTALASSLAHSGAVPADSPIYPAKMAVWARLNSLGWNLPTPPDRP